MMKFRKFIDEDRSVKGKLPFLMAVACLFLFVLTAIPLSTRAQDYRYIASKFSINYHHPNCRRVLKVQSQNRVTFKTAKQALEAGYLPCTLCKPPAQESIKETMEDTDEAIAEKYLLHNMF